MSCLIIRSRIFLNSKEKKIKFRDDKHTNSPMKCRFLNAESRAERLKPESNFISENESSSDKLELGNHRKVSGHRDVHTVVSYFA